MAEAYTVLARRYRSRNFDELIGQEAIAQTLKNAVASGRLAHAFLFTGTRGVGKTSSARILAKAINCPQAKAGQPCGVCATCQAIARGEDIDVIEIDGASNNGVDQIRDLRANAGVTPSHSPFKIYIIDEVHMLSMPAFNALLKSLEEPPPHVKFIFATTDVHKLPATILSRCQRYDFKNISTADIAAHLAAICQQEKVQADGAALHRIALLANGSMRDALSLLDRVLSLGAGHVTEAMLEDLLGKPPLAAVSGLVAAIAGQDAAGALNSADAMLNDGMGMEQALSELVEFFRNLMVVRVCGDQTPLLDVPSEWKTSFMKLAPGFDAPTLVHHIALCDQTLRSLRSSTLSRPLFDALIVRLAQCEQFSSIRDLLAQTAGGANTPAAAAPQKKNDLINPPTAVAPRPENGRHPAAELQPTLASPAEPDPASHPLASAESTTAAGDLGPAFAAHLKKLSPSTLTMLNGRSKLELTDPTAGRVRLEIPGNLKAWARSEKVRAYFQEAARLAAGRTVAIEYVFTQTASPTGTPASAHPAPPGHPATGATPSRGVAPELLDRANELPAVKLILEKFDGAAVTSVEIVDNGSAA